MLLQRGNQSTGVLRRATRTSGGVGRRKHVMVGLPAKNTFESIGGHKVHGKWGLSRDDPHVT